MPKRYVLILTAPEKTTLERWLKNPPRPYLRERARAILQVSQGTTIQAATAALRIRIHRNAVAEWVHRFLAHRLAGLKIKAGRGRKPVFSPARTARRQPTG